MNKDFWKDYLSYTAFKLIGPVVRLLPFGLSMCLGRAVGELIYWFDYKHRAIAYSNIKRAMGDKVPACRLRKITRNFFRAFGQNIIDIFLIPLIGKKHMDKYLEIDGRENIAAAFKKGKGVIFLAVHAGSWELSNVICANLGFPFRLFVRSQNMPRLNKLLNTYRRQNGCRIFEREDQNQLRQLIKALKDNEAIGMTADQGGKNGMLVDFFGKTASMPSGAIRLALKYDAVILPAFYSRAKDAYYKLIVDPPFELKKTGDAEADVRVNLQAAVKLFEKHILDYPTEYLWTYKIWKYSDIRDILVLHDGKTGHLRQAEAAAKAAAESFKERGIFSRISIVEVKFRSRFGRNCLALCGCVTCLRKFISQASYGLLTRSAADMVISCGSSLSAVNYVIAKENRAKSVVIMRPGLMGTHSFDLVVIPRHDRPAKRKNVLITDGALNLIDDDHGAGLAAAGSKIGILLGGDSKDFRLDVGQVKAMISQVKEFARKTGVGILVTTSRRTSPEIEGLVKAAFKDYPACSLLIIANENNPEFSLAKIIAASRILVVSPESISMVSEAASSGRYVVVFDVPVAKRHRRFLASLAEKKYIYLRPAQEIGKIMEELNSRQPQVHVLHDRQMLKQAISRII
jgi:Kdo2-lipid IVA lauroyltransferase/acyltransferase